MIFIDNFTQKVMTKDDFCMSTMYVNYVTQQEE